MRRGSLDDLELPPGSSLVRTTPAFDSESVPDALLSSHRVAQGVWGLVRVEAGEVTFTSESTGDERVLGPGQTQVIEPDTPHRVAPDAQARFVVEFYR